MVSRLTPVIAEMASCARSSLREIKSGAQVVSAAPEQAAHDSSKIQYVEWHSELRSEPSGRQCLAHTRLPDKDGRARWSQAPRQQPIRLTTLPNQLIQLVLELAKQQWVLSVCLSSPIDSRSGECLCQIGRRGLLCSSVLLSIFSSRFCRPLRSSLRAQYTKASSGVSSDQLIELLQTEYRPDSRTGVFNLQGVNSRDNFCQSRVEMHSARSSSPRHS